jgi:L-threonylcarbamoyladenylate synthase
LIDTLILKADDPAALSLALEILAGGGLIAFPTDTVYGVGGLAFSPQAIDEIYRVKGRLAEKAIPVLLGNSGQLSQVTEELNPFAQRLAERYWPGPLTLVVLKKPSLPENLSPHPTVGVRMPDHPAALRLLNLAGPLAVTSANLSGAANCTTAQQVLEQLGGSIPLILDGGETPGGQPSSVVDCTGEAPVLLRPGPISMEEITSVLS